MHDNYYHACSSVCLNSTHGCFLCTYIVYLLRGYAIVLQAPHSV